MNENMYVLLNEIDNEAEDYETWEVSQDEVRRWKAAFRQKRKEKRENPAIGYVAAAVVVLMIVFGISPIRNQVYAQIMKVSSDIRGWLGVTSDLLPYATVVGESVSKGGVTVTLDEALVDGNQLIISYTTTTTEMIVGDSWCTDEYFSYMELFIDGKQMDVQSATKTTKEDIFNLSSMTTFYVDDEDLAAEHDYKIKLYFARKKIGTIKFTATGEKLSKDTLVVPINANYELPNGDTICFTEFISNPAGMKINCEAEKTEAGYVIVLKGQDDIGNEVAFVHTNYSDTGDGVMIPMKNNMLEEAKSMTLKVYMEKYSDGEMVEEKAIGEAFTIQIR